MSTDAITKKGVLESQAPAPFDVEDTLSVHEEPGKSKGGKAHSMAIAVFAMCCAMIGSGIVGLPSAMAKLSFYIGVPALMFASVATGYTGITLGYIAQNTRKLGNGGYIESYPAIGKVLYGPKVESFVLFVQWINVYSVSMLYLILAAMNMNLLVPSIHAKYWTLIIGGIILPFSWIKTFREMLSVTAFGFFASLILVISVLAEDAAFTHDAKIPTSSEYGNISIKSVFQGWGTIVFAFGGHCLFIDMVRSMPNKSVFKNSVIVGYTITTALYLVVACTCYGLYGQQLQSEGSMLNVIPDNWLSKLAISAVTVHVTLAVVIFLNPAFLYFEGYAAEKSRGGSAEGFCNSYSFRIVWRTLNIGLIIFLAEAIPNFGDIQSLIGASAVTMLCFIFPCWFYLKMYWDTLSKAVIAWNIILLVIGSFSGILATYFAVEAVIESLSEMGTYL